MLILIQLDATTNILNDASFIAKSTVCRVIDKSLHIITECILDLCKENISQFPIDDSIRLKLPIYDF